MRIHCELFGPPDESVWYYLLHHDSAELVTGDIPFPQKRDNPDLKATMNRLEKAALEGIGVTGAPISENAKFRCKFCDLVDMWEFGLVELSMGNRYARPIVDATWKEIASFGYGRDVMDKLYHTERRLLSHD